MTHSHTFSRASNLDWFTVLSLFIVIDQSDYFGYGFTPFISECDSYENEFRLHVHFYANHTHFHLNGFALRLVLKQRHKGSEKAY